MRLAAESAMLATRGKFDQGLVLADAVRKAIGVARYAASEVVRRRVDRRLPAGIVEPKIPSIETLQKILDIAAEHPRYSGAAALEMQRFIVGAQRRTTAEAAFAAGRKLVRVPDADPCSFCAAMCSFPVGAREYKAEGGVFHRSCGCSVVEMLGAWQPEGEIAVWSDKMEELGNDVAEFQRWYRDRMHK